MRLRLFLCFLTIAMPAAAATAGDEADLAAFERALAAGDLRAAGAAAKRLRQVRQSPGTPLRADPLLSGLYGRMRLRGDHALQASAFLRRAEGPDVPPAQRSAAILALAQARERVGDIEGAFAALARLEGVPADEAKRREAALARARLQLAADPRAALASLSGLAGWEAELIAAQARSLLQEPAAARAAADRAWIAAASAAAEDLAPLRVALLRAGLASAAGDRPALLAMLNSAGAASTRLGRRVADHLPVCGDAGIEPSDQVTLAVWRGPIEPPRLMVVAASRSAAVRPFLDALTGRDLLEGEASTPAGLVFTVGCRSHVSASYEGSIREPDVWAEWLAERGLYSEPPSRGDIQDIEALADEIDSLARAQGDDYPPLIPLRVQLAAWLADPSSPAGSHRWDEIAELRRKVAAAVRKLGGPVGLVASEGQIAEEQALARAETREQFVGLMRPVVERRIAILPLNDAYAEMARWFETDTELPTADRIQVVEGLIRRTEPLAGDPRRQALLVRLAALERAAGDWPAVEAAVRRAGLPVDACMALPVLPVMTHQPIDDDSYPLDGLKFSLEGVTTFEFGVSAEGRIAGHRIVLAAPAGIFESVVAEKIPAFRLTLPKDDGGARPCAGNIQSIYWRLPSDETGQPVFGGAGTGQR
jgi:hypothetical protein